MIWRYLLYTHLFLAAAAVALQYATMYWLNIATPRSAYLLCFTFFATLFAYNVPVVIRRAVITDQDRFKWSEENHAVLRILTILSLSICIYLFIKIATISLVTLLFPSAVFAVFYSIPVLHLRSLNRMSYLKTFIVAGVWTLVTFYMPLAVAEVNTGHTLLGIQRFVLMIILVLPFEVRDIGKDKAMGVVTLATALGEWKVRYLGFFLLIAEVLLSWRANGFTTLFYVHLIMAVIVGVYYMIFRRTWSDARYMLWGDGLLFIPLALTVIFM
jgi:hypothetical protein